MEYIIPVVLAVFCISVIAGLLWYVHIRIRWHEKCILDLNYDGWEHRNDPTAKTIFSCIRDEKEYDRRMKGKKK